ncbi:MFS transporter [Conexibacter woesei]|uniref:Drug resistance transporter, EmrB/QacA subfamily n=1 Tax=Conexibacter woesei (strain DSM 14684 / CCUG 47730 / CIP 108061 / JCM 11494 / NBRC 100937 / ID131577) TaxID=469383 RepID=D3F0R7_CONWI|nr:MFS transporter [Conexibacter woesei]ADB54001.1 drug resistance transporter, EmrB/QacA subfamily [Conexibacter woesei DSM 14684]
MAAARPPDSHPGWAGLAAVCLGTFMLLVDVTIVNVALPEMAPALGASFSDLQWIVTAYALTLAALLLLIGSLSDVVGRRRTYLAGLGVFAAASLACGLAPSVDVLIAARAVQGVGGAAMFATSIALISATYSGSARGVAFGIWSATNGAAASAGPIVGGLLTQGLSWRWVFFVNVPLGLVAIAVARRALREPPVAAGRRIDWAGGIAFTLAAAAATVTVMEAGGEGWTSAWTLGPLAVAVLGLCAFVAIESRSRAPLLDLGLLRRGTLTGVLIAAAFLMATAFGALPYASIWLQSVLGLDPVEAGLVIVPLSASAFVVAVAGGRLSQRIAPRRVFGVALALIAIGDVLQAGLDGGSEWPRLLAGVVVVGIGVGVASPVLASAAVDAVPHDRAGMAAGAVNTARQFGLVLGIAVLGSVFSARIADRLGGELRRSGDAELVASGGARTVLDAAPVADRAQLDGAIRDAVSAALGTTFLIASLAALLGLALVLALLRTRPAG